MSIRRKIKEFERIKKMLIFFLIVDVLAIFITASMERLSTILILILIFLILNLYLYNARINNLFNAINYLKKKGLLDKKIQAIIYGDGGATVLFYKRRMIIINDKKILNIKYKGIVLYYINFKLIQSGHWYKINLILNNNQKLTIFTDEKFFFGIKTILIKNIEKLIKTENPNVLVGNTKENKKILEEKYGIKI